MLKSDKERLNLLLFQDEYTPNRKQRLPFQREGEKTNKNLLLCRSSMEIWKKKIKLHKLELR